MATALIPVAAPAWVHLRPRVVAVSDQGMGVFDEGAAAKVFGADVTFAVITAIVALISASVAVLPARTEHLTASAVVLGAALQLGFSSLVLVVGPFIDGVDAHWDAPFPPERLAVGATLIEPARVHAYGVLAAAPLMWLVVVLIASAVRSDKR
ncbi:MAG: hypothetical protein EBU85_02235 [Actinobacteria bacterium]|nr:hypothetical protein [Actinomycetota bacterium]